jgi:hypothetical protein
VLPAGRVAAGELSERWTPDALTRLLARAPAPIGVGTNRNMAVSVEVEVLDRAPGGENLRAGTSPRSAPSTCRRASASSAAAPTAAITSRSGRARWRSRLL